MFRTLHQVVKDAGIIGTRFTAITRVAVEKAQNRCEILILSSVKGMSGDVSLRQMPFPANMVGGSHCRDSVLSLVSACLVFIVSQFRIAYVHMYLVLCTMT